MRRILFATLAGIFGLMLLNACNNRWEALERGFQTPPDSIRTAVYWYRLDISDLVKEGENSLEITVYNNWRNRLIADERLPEAERKTWTNYQPYGAGDDLQSSGLLGPITLYTL